MKSQKEISERINHLRAIELASLQAGVPMDRYHEGWLFALEWVADVKRCGVKR